MWTPNNPERIGRCRLGRLLGVGGTSRVYLAEREDDGQPVVIKVMHPELAEDDRFVKMLGDEARLLSRIHHPHVVRVFGFGRAGDSHYLELEYVDGCSLADLVDGMRAMRRRMSVSAAVHIVLCVADALQAAHDATDEAGTSLGIVHRDVSLHNVLLSRDGGVKLIDFGIAKAAGRLQKTGMLLKGTARYMSPEQARGGALDARSDVYALGIVLWELLTGQPLYDGDNFDDVLAMARAPFVLPPSEYEPALPEVLDRVVLAALARSPGSRPPSAQAFRARLARAVPLAEAIDTGDLEDLLAHVLGSGHGHTTPLSIATDRAASRSERCELPTEMLADPSAEPSSEMSDLLEDLASLADDYPVAADAMVANDRRAAHEDEHGDEESEPTLVFLRAPPEHLAETSLATTR